MHLSVGAIYYNSDRYVHLTFLVIKNIKCLPAKLPLVEMLYKVPVMVAEGTEPFGYYFLGSLQFSSLIESLRLMTTPCF